MIKGRVRVRVRVRVTGRVGLRSQPAEHRPLQAPLR